MNILLSPDSFKGTLTSSEVCDIIESALRNRIPDCNVIKLPAADGGEGLCSSFANFIDGEWISAESKDPFNSPMRTEYYMLENGVAVIETASCAGLPLAGDRADPTVTTTAGVGMLMRDAEQRGAKRIILGLGGSATNDCGAGMASELGFVFLDKNGNAFVPVGGTLADIEHIISPKEPFGVPVTAACDVTNPLFGADGAAYVFAPQKGANAEQVRALDLGLRHMSKILKRELGFDSDNLPGAGAAGGLGAGAAAFLNARLKSGIDIVLDESGFDELAKSADVIVTGEGRFDSQSIRGKVMSGVCKRAAKSGAAVYAVCGCASSDADPAELGIKKLFVSSDGTRTMDELLISCRRELYAAATALAQELLKCD